MFHLCLLHCVSVSLSLSVFFSLSLSLCQRVLLLDSLLLLYMETLIFGFTVQFLSTDSNLEDLPTDKSRQAGCTQVG